MLELVSRLGFEADRFFRQTHFTFGLDVVAQHGTSARIAHCLNLREDNLAIPDILCQAHVDVIHKRFQLNHFVAGLSGWRFGVFEVASDRPFRATNLSRNIDNVRALLAHLLYHVKVLSTQHVDVLSGVRTLRKQHVGCGADNQNGELPSYITGANTTALAKIRRALNEYERQLNKTHSNEV